MDPRPAIDFTGMTPFQTVIAYAVIQAVAMLGSWKGIKHEIDKQGIKLDDYGTKIEDVKQSQRRFEERQDVFDHRQDRLEKKVEEHNRFDKRLIELQTRLEERTRTTHGDSN